MHLLCVLIGVVALVGTAVHAQPLSYDPYYVLPGGTGYASVDVGVRTIASPSKLKELKDASDIIAVAKFNPHARFEAGARISPLAFSRTGVPTLPRSWSAASTSSAPAARQPLT